MSRPRVATLPVRVSPLSGLADSIAGLSFSVFISAPQGPRSDIRSWWLGLPTRNGRRMSVNIDVFAPTGRTERHG